MFVCGWQIVIVFLGLVSVSIELWADQSSEEAFSEIYDKGVWGNNAKGEAWSGGGSSLGATEKYRDFLKHFMAEFQIHSVVDAGCGDWEFSKAIDWKGIDYIGYDVVPSLIEKNQNAFGSPGIRFVRSDAIFADLPRADLLICKDVLQHLPNEDIFALIQQFPKFKYCLITNDVNLSMSLNGNIVRGEYRPLDITKSPFHLKATPILTYVVESSVKQVLLIIRNDG